MRKLGLVIWIMGLLAYAMIITTMYIFSFSLPIMAIVTVIVWPVVWYLNRRFSAGWKVNVEIYTKRGYAWPIFYDKYRHIKKPDGDEYGELKNAKVRIKPIDYRFIERDERGKFKLKMASPAKGEYHPIKFDTNTRQLVGVVDPFLMNWLTTENKRAVMKWQKHDLLTTLIQYLPIIIVVVVCVLMLVIFIDELIKLIQPLIGATDSLAKASDRLADAVEMMNQNKGVSQP